MEATWIVVMVTVFLGAALQGAVGIGLGVLASPVLVLLRPELVPGPLLAANVMLTVLVLLRDRRSMDVRGVALALVGRLPGSMLGALLVSWVVGLWLDLTAGALLLGCVALAAAGDRLAWSPTRRHFLAAGLLSGLTGTAVSVGGPPIALLYRHADGARLRGTLGGYFLVGAGFSLVMLATVGRFGRGEVIESLRLAPSVVLGFALSMKLAPRLEQTQRIRSAVLLVSGLAAAAVLVRGLVGLASL